MAVKAKRKKIIIAALSALGCVLSHLGAMAADAVAATDSDIGKVIGADGVVYASVADAEDAQTTAYAMIAYINNAGSFGLAIAVGDADGPCAWDDAKYAATSWAAARPAGFGSWRLLSADEWFTIFRECYGYSEGSDYYDYGSFRDFLTSCGAADMQDGSYWTCDEVSASEVRTCDFSHYNYDRFANTPKTERSYVRLCLEFSLPSDTAGRTGDCRWEFDVDTQTLTISGNGAMADYASQDWAPWHEHLKASITNVVIESGVENVGDCAFYECSALTGVSMPNTVTNIGEGAFYRCNSLRDFAVPQNLVSIGNAAFYQCSALTTFTLPATVASIGTDVFMSCDGIADVYCHPDPANLSWEDATRDFKSNGETFIHVNDGQIADYEDKFKAVVRGTFIGDASSIPYGVWAEKCGFTVSSGGVKLDEIAFGSQTSIPISDGVSVQGWFGYSDGSAKKVFSLSTEYEAYGKTWAAAFSQIETWQGALSGGKAVLRLPSADELKRFLSGCGGSAYTEDLYDGMLFSPGALDEKFNNTAIWTSTEDGEGNAWVYAYGEPGGWRFTKRAKTATAGVLALIVLDVYSPGWALCDKSDGIANVFRYAFDKPTGDFHDEPLIDISFDLAGNPVIKTPKVVNTTGFAYRVESARDPAFSRIVGSKSLGSGSVTFDKSDEPRFFRLTATAR